VSSRDDSHLPPLPDEARFALSAFRSERPSPQQEARLREALRAAEAGRVLPGRHGEQAPKRSWNSRRVLGAVMGAALAGGLLSVRLQRPEALDTSAIIHEAFPQREVAFQVPEGGGWVVLPWNLDRHPEGKATVHLEAPAELEFHRHSAHLPAVQLVSCEGDRCMHRFTARAGEASEPLRVRIHRPGRYVFNISHASEARRIDESFVVTAEPFR
jgi:hypothetical protein